MTHEKTEGQNHANARIYLMMKNLD